MHIIFIIFINLFEFPTNQNLKNSTYNPLVFDYIHYNRDFALSSQAKLMYIGEGVCIFIGCANNLSYPERGMF